MFFFPLYDDNPTKNPAYITWLIIASCVVVHLWKMGLSVDQDHLISLQYGVVPKLFLGGDQLPPEYQAIPPMLSPFTSMFLHGGLFHLGGNMLFLWIFGNNVEDTMGKGRFIIFYILCGYAAAFFQAIFDVDSTIPMIGASGAIAGVLAAYALLFPKANVKTFVLVLVFFRIVSIPAAAILLGWFLMQTIEGMKFDGGGGVAYFAHIGGFIAGLMMVKAFLPRGVKLFQKLRTIPFEVTPITLPSQRRPAHRKRGSVPDAGSKSSGGYKRPPWAKD